MVTDFPVSVISHTHEQKSKKPKENQTKKNSIQIVWEIGKGSMKADQRV